MTCMYVHTVSSSSPPIEEEEEESPEHPSSVSIRVTPADTNTTKATVHRNAQQQQDVPIGPPGRPPPRANPGPSPGPPKNNPGVGGAPGPLNPPPPATGPPPPPPPLYRPLPGPPPKSPPGTPPPPGFPPPPPPPSPGPGIFFIHCEADQVEVGVLRVYVRMILADAA